MKRVMVRSFGSEGCCLAFNTTFELTQTNFHKFDRPLRRSSDRYLAEIGEPGAIVVCALFALPGVTSIIIKPYQLLLDKGEAFDWSFEGVDLKAEVIRLLGEHFGPIDELIDKTEGAIEPDQPEVI